jgi:hypothetical protein
VQLFLVAVLASEGAPPDLGGALRDAATAFPQLDPGDVVSGRSRSGRVAWARLAHPQERAAPRVYAARAGDHEVLFDGFPLAPGGRFAAHDAAALAAHWDELPEALDGLFSVVRVDTERDVVECLLDAIGLAPVFAAGSPGGTQLLGNSVDALRRLLPAPAPDPLGVGSLVALGWPGGDRTLDAGVEVLRGGRVHILAPGRREERVHASPATVLDAARRRPPLPVERMRAATEAAARSGAPLTGALTAGRDTRVLLALARAAHADVAFYTSGTAESFDVQVAEAMARRWDLRHELVREAVPDDDADWIAMTTAFSRRTDGLSPIDAIADQLDHEGRHGPLALELWGAAGEIGRTIKWVSNGLAQSAPLIRGSYAVQRRMVQRTFRDPAGLLRPEAADGVRAWLDAFVDERRGEGWPAPSILSTFYAWARVRHWAARGVRRAAATADLFTPFASRAYLEHALSLTGGERWTEQPHRRLIATLAPEIDVDPYEIPWQPDRPDHAFALLAAEGARRISRRLRRAPAGPPTAPDLGAAWVEAGTALHTEVALSASSSPLWDVLDRAGYERLVGSPEARAAHGTSLARALSAVWWFHGPRQ